MATTTTTVLAPQHPAHFDSKTDSDTELVQVTSTPPLNASAAFPPVCVDPNDPTLVDEVVVAPEKLVSWYSVCEQVGKGLVFEGFHNETGIPVIVKQCKHRREWVSHLAAQYDASEFALETLCHPHVIQLYHVCKVPPQGITILDALIEDGYLLVMERGDQDMLQLIRNHRPLVHPELLVTQCLLSALHLHTAQNRFQNVVPGSLLSLAFPAHQPLPQLVHSDIKPENFFVLDYHCVKLGDFGGVVAQHTPPTTLTVSYCAPEQFNKTCCPASDLYAIAVVAYVLCTGKFFKKVGGQLKQLSKGTVKRLIAGHYLRTPEHIQQLFERTYSPDMAVFLQECLALCPSSRPTTSQLAFLLLPQTYEQVLGDTVQDVALTPCSSSQVLGHKDRMQPFAMDTSSDDAGSCSCAATDDTTTDYSTTPAQEPPPYVPSQ
eukprot:m.19587 g.19587  ORF g.19587 m.19587 type:complete len:433 (-) comp8054_c0_seq1:205-1503(-)